MVKAQPGTPVTGSLRGIVHAEWAAAEGAGYERGELGSSALDDGACLQIGIGAMPNAVCSLLMETGVRNLGIHTEMLTDGIIDLYKAGVVTGSAKTSHPGKIVCSFGLGSDHLRDRPRDDP